MGDRIRVQLMVQLTLSWYVNSNPGQLSLAIPGRMSTKKMVGVAVWLGSKGRYGSCLVAGKTV